VESRKLADNADVGRLDADGEQVEIGCGTADEPALRTTDIEHVFHAVVAQHLGDRVPSLVGVADIGKTPAPDFDRLIRPAARLGPVERSFDQAKREAPADRARPFSPDSPAIAAVVARDKR
jgi:hypothetical protein